MTSTDDKKKELKSILKKPKEEVKDLMTIDELNQEQSIDPSEIGDLEIVEHYLTPANIEEYYKKNKYIIDIGKYTRYTFGADPKRIYNFIQFGLKAVATDADLDILSLMDCLKDLTKGDYVTLSSEEDIKYMIKEGLLNENRYEKNIHEKINKILNEPDCKIKPLTRKGMYDLLWNIGEFECRWFEHKSKIKYTHERCINAMSKIMDYLKSQDEKCLCLHHTKDMMKYKENQLVTDL